MEKTSKKRICLALGYVQAEDAITKIIDNNYRNKYEIVSNVRSKEALLDTVQKEKFEVVILREDLPGNVDLIEILKTIRSGAENTQIIFFMNNRQNGDPFFIELFLFNVYDFVVLPNIKLDEVFGFLEKPRMFKDIARYLPIRTERVRNLIIEANKDLKAPLKLDADGDIDEVMDININKKKPEPEVIVKEVVKYIEKPIIREVIKEVPVQVPVQQPVQQTPQENIYSNYDPKPEDFIPEIKKEEKPVEIEKPKSFEESLETFNPVEEPKYEMKEEPKVEKTKEESYNGIKLDLDDIEEDDI